MQSGVAPANAIIIITIIIKSNESHYCFVYYSMEIAEEEKNVMLNKYGWFKSCFSGF